MSSNSFHMRIDGLQELRESFRGLPRALAEQAKPLIERRADEAFSRIHAVYAAHRVTGDLADKLSQKTIEIGQFGFGVLLVSASAHAGYFEDGTDARQLSGPKAGKAATVVGASTAHPTFIPAMRAARRGLADDLRALLERNGMTVNG